MSQAAEASGQFYGGAAPDAISHEWGIIRAYDANTGPVSAEEYLSADFAVRQYAADACVGLSLTADGAVVLDAEY